MALFMTKAEAVSLQALPRGNAIVCDRHPHSSDPGSAASTWTELTVPLLSTAVLGQVWALQHKRGTAVSCKGPQKGMESSLLGGTAERAGTPQFG